MKLLDYLDREADLESRPNPFASFVVAHLAALATDADPAERLARKIAVVKRLYSRGLTRADIRRLFRLVDWVITLPAFLETKFGHEIDAFERETQMPFISPIEKLWMSRAHRNGIRVGLKLRFGQAGLDLMPRVEKLSDPDAVEAFLNAIETAPDLAALAALLPPA